MAKFNGEFLKTKKMDISKYIPEGELVLREPMRKAVMAMKKKGEAGEEPAMDAFIAAAPDIVIGHNVEDEGGKMETKKLLDKLFESLEFTMDFIEEVSAFFPSAKRRNEE